MRTPRVSAKARSLFRFAACLFVWCCTGAVAFTPKPADAAVDTSEWTWDILVVPPDDGWEAETGSSIRKTLLWHQAEISESGNGVQGHDINFIFLPPTTEDRVRSYDIPFTSRTVAMLSFASYPVDRDLVGHMAGRGIPLLLAEGENVSSHEKNLLLPFLFALDLYRDYRCRAFADYALKTLEPQSRLGIIGTRFTLNEEREAKICFDLFSEAGFMPMPYWADATVSDVFGMVEQEIKSYSQGVLISYAGGMASKELWRGLSGYFSPYRLWYGGTPDKSFLSFKGMIFADQNLFLETHGGFEQLKRDLWTTRTLGVTDKVAAGRANALAVWLTRALTALPGGNPIADKKSLLSRLADVENIPFGNQVLSIDRETHRPKSRQVHILEIRDRSFFILDTLSVKGLKHYDY